MNENEDDDLRDLLDDATRDVRPRTTYDDIRSRIDQEDPVAQQARRWFAPALVAAAVMALVVGGAFWMTRDDDGPTAPAGQPSVTGSATDTPTDGPTAGLVTQEVTTFYVGDSAGTPKVFAETRSVTYDGANPPLLALREAVRIPAADPDYASFWPQGVRIDGASFDGVGDAGVIQIEVSSPAAADRPAGVSEAQARAQVEALVRTAQRAFDAQAAVEFHRADSRLTQVLGVTGPQFTAGVDDEVLAPVQITSLLDGQTVKRGALTVSGVAAAFEANVQWELTKPSGTVAQDGFATAAECCTLAPYEFEITGLKPGTYTLTVHDEDMSGEGRPVNSDSKRIVVE